VLLVQYLEGRVCVCVCVGAVFLECMCGVIFLVGFIP
jgi:hypothetical protein